MLDTIYAQLRYAASLLFAWPLHLSSLDRMIEAVQATRTEFGALTSDAHTLVSGPVLDTDAQRQFQLARFRLQAARGAGETAYYAAMFDRLACDYANFNSLWL